LFIPPPGLRQKNCSGFSFSYRFIEGQGLQLRILHLFFSPLKNGPPQNPELAGTGTASGVDLREEMNYLP
jgi:hypothetical protein